MAMQGSHGGLSATPRDYGQMVQERIDQASADPDQPLVIDANREQLVNHDIRDLLRRLRSRPKRKAAPRWGIWAEALLLAAGEHRAYFTAAGHMQHGQVPHMPSPY